MNPHTYELLTELRERTGREYGKLVQKLLAIAFLESGVDELVDRCVQGIDLELKTGGRHIALEVKTTETAQVTLGRKDLEGLERQRKQGAEPYVAFLGGGLLDEWIFARYHPGELPAGKKIGAFRLRAYRDRELEGRIQSLFEAAVAQHVNVATFERQAGLDRVLAGYAARQLA